MYFIFLITFFLLSSALEPFSQLQTLNDYPNQLYSIDVSDDNRILVAAHDYGTNVWIKNQSQFSLAQTIQENSEIAYFADISGDRKMLVVLYTEIGKTVVYKNLGYAFTKLQTFFSDSYAVVMTDDHQWIALAAYQKIHIYYFNGFEYQKHHDIPIAMETRFVQLAMSQDSAFLIVGTVGEYVSIFYKNGKKFQFIQRLIDTKSFNVLTLVSITADHYYLTISDWEEKIAFLYQYNEPLKKFQLKEKNKSENFQYASMSQNKQWFCVSGDFQTSIYKSKGKMEKIQTFPKNSMTHKFSKDGQYIFIGRKELNIYKLVCDVDKGEFYNVTTQLCQICEKDHFFRTTGTCKSCDIEGCAICQNYDKCQICDYQTNYFLNKKTFKCDKGWRTVLLLGLLVLIIVIFSVCFGKICLKWKQKKREQEKQRFVEEGLQLFQTQRRKGLME